jgi:hypothetical protein
VGRVKRAEAMAVRLFSLNAFWSHLFSGAVVFIRSKIDGFLHP